MRVDTFASHLSETEAAEIALSAWGLAGALHRLPGEYDDNFRLILKDGSERVLKVMHPEREALFVDLQVAALVHVARTAPDLETPRVVPTAAGTSWTQMETAGGPRLVWILGWVSGRPLAEVEARTPELLGSVGRLLGRVGLALSGFEHLALDRELRWDLARAGWIRDRLDAIADSERRGLVERTIARFDEKAVPALAALPKVAIHGDANDWNVLVRGGRGRAPEAVSLIDFGDMVRSARICDLAIGAAYALFGVEDPLAALAQVAAGYREVAPLTETEVEILAPLVAMRLAVSVTNAAIRRSLAPDDPYVSVSEAPAWATLEALDRIPPRLVRATLRHVCGLAPLAVSAIESLKNESPAPILAPPLLDRLARVRPLDLSVGSLLLGADPKHLEPAGLRALIERELGVGDGAEIGLGLYGEARLLGPIPPEPGTEPATIQLGAELFLPEGSEIRSPFAGTLVEVLETDAGPRLLIEHAALTPGPSPKGRGEQSKNGSVQFSPLPLGEGPGVRALWLGLDADSLPAIGTVIACGAPIGRVAGPEGNGGWPPHIHLQLLVDDLGLGARFPTAVRPSERAVWQTLSPDPTELLGVPAERLPAPLPTFDEILAARRSRLGGNLSLSYRRPLGIVRGFRQHLFDAEGRAYLDVYNNVAHVGHQHSRVVEAIRAQAGLLNTNTRYLHPNLVRYAERLAAKMPAPLSVVYVINSASEANELALRLARAVTGGRDLIVLEAAYHGHTTSLIDASPYKHDGPGGAGAPDWVHTAPIPDDYRGAWKRDDPQAGPKFARPVEEIAARLAQEGRRATFLAESLPSVGGQIVPPPGYLEAVYRAIRTHGGVTITDEVQTGFGRLGHAFWGFELQGVVPDIVVLGKPIGNGHPLGAVVTTPEIAAAFDNGMEFFSTFGGNPVSCAAGLAVLDVVEEEGLQENARRVGDRLLADLRALTTRHEIAGDARGVGLFLGLELVRNRETLEPATEEAAYTVDRLRDLGILAGTDGPHHNVIKLRPAMIFGDEDADRLIAGLDRVLREVGSLV
ncbi:MAG TPA: aminotransferase class III-fold pyridoxal phosphate-dependent enzyme [Thermoanaerobaculia bacterium]|jgi:4-aminobutyrate aminotransferase-like enzyme/Ser/Thr protein kinase RdoA (MazF antagonist)|nr:aminotransferase class III-fold pyridoxal phosphate-dependent enzyme [Thermoanaerobaculia bacterium]